MDIINRGNEPTFVTATRSEVLDITLASMNISSSIHGWRVEEEPSMSDHRTITFGIDSTKPRLGSRRRPKDTNWDGYRDELADRLAHLKGKYGTGQGLEWTTQQIHEAMVGAYENNCPIKPCRRPDGVSWWSEKLEALRVCARRAFNRAKKRKSPEGWGAYKTALQNFKREVTSAKRERWREFCTKVDGLSETARLARILTRDNDARLTCLKDGLGGYAESEEDILNLLLEANFPDFVREEDTVIQTVCERRPYGLADWGLAALVVTSEKVKWAINSFEPYKTPGPDGIFPKMLQEGGGHIIRTVTGVLRGCIAIGYVPASWRITRVSFIPKPGRRSYQTVKDFRPISLTSFLLKTLEKIVDNYVRDNVLTGCPLHRWQHAYTVGLSTETALHSVVSYIEESLEARETVIGAFVDIEGAFNSTTRDCPFKMPCLDLGYLRPLLDGSEGF
uniref:Uncharacterized protein n=1 Tax=Clastoptera arizonana TaxID=38151 RepID=A0A1B6E7F2_9HEMI